MLVGSLKSELNSCSFLLTASLIELDDLIASMNYFFKLES